MTDATEAWTLTELENILDALALAQPEDGNAIRILRKALGIGAESDPMQPRVWMSWDINNVMNAIESRQPSCRDAYDGVRVALGIRSQASVDLQRWTVVEPKQLEDKCKS